ncbi:DNA gyrase subunit A [Rhizobiales bacterium RZME27]|uniref:DNA gyrase subunit A n=1 Tax=Endobacterium cereale TaxID=2663029 RepID=A0A6A8A2B4_9HYPH|nr:DNA gyrase subunit A [Endobacterium cereale]MEB2843455.1 DNA gyrase subunit A [Endobacterium cereale]MQY44574.1 DNA gyrase subunit A [Endobacterium cereale]
MTDQSTPGGGKLPPGIEPISIMEEMQRSYLDYAMSVIVSRALPDVRDGLKPVHRRILYGMNELGLDWNKKYVKSARVTGDVMGKYHPHGDSAIYDALARMAQDWSLRLPLIDGQGNFGSIDGDPPAAQRYTECRLEKVSHALLDDLDKETVDFRDNYDGTMSEPVVVPAKFPNLLVNGAGGIAVGMATNIPPHNLSEVINGCIALIDNPAIELPEMMEIIPGPDFPTGAMILGKNGIRSAYETGRGSVMMRGLATIEPMRGDREQIIITEVPYQVNKATMIEKMAELVKEKRVEGISDLRDESDRQGYRVVIELKRDANADVILNQLYRYTPLQTSFGCNMVALNGGKPEQMILLDMLRAFVSFREEVVSRRTKYLLRKARERAHVLVGLAIAVANIDEVIALIRRAPDPATAREQLMTRRWPAHDVEPLIRLIDDPRHKINDDATYNLSEEQARAILELRLARLTALGRDEIADELNKIGAEISDYLDILSSRVRIQTIVKAELAAVRDEFGTPRRTQIMDAGLDMDDEDLIAREDMVVTVSHLGYIKRVPLATYRAQRRGGKGRSGMATRDEDFVSRLFVVNTHTPVLFFSSRGIVYKEKVYRLPIGTPQSRGKALINMLPLEAGERITTIMPLPEDEATWENLDVMFATTRGTVRRNKLSDFVQVNRNGKIAMKLEEEGDEILSVETCTAPNHDLAIPGDDVLLTTALGQAIRFPVDEVRVFAGRNSIGVRGINMADGDRIISMTIVGHVDAEPWERAAYLKRSATERRAAGVDEDDIALVGEEVVEEGQLSDERYEYLKEHEQFVLTVSEKGFGKRSSSYDFRTSGRGGKGIRATDTSKTAEIGEQVALFPIEDKDQIMLVTDGGVLIRVPVDGIRIASRATKGVTIFSTGKGEKVVSVERISEPEGEEEEGDVPGEITTEGGAITEAPEGGAPEGDAPSEE